MLIDTGVESSHTIALWCNKAVSFQTIAGLTAPERQSDEVPLVQLTSGLVYLSR